MSILSGRCTAHLLGTDTKERVKTVDLKKIAGICKKTHIFYIKTIVDDSGAPVDQWVQLSYAAYRIGNMGLTYRTHWHAWLESRRTTMRQTEVEGQED